jgi:hypothetical protein
VFSALRRSKDGVRQLQAILISRSESSKTSNPATFAPQHAKFQTKRQMRRSPTTAATSIILGLSFHYLARISKAATIAVSPVTQPLLAVSRATTMLTTKPILTSYRQTFKPAKLAAHFTVIT